MELLKFFKARTFDNRKCQSTTDFSSLYSSKTSALARQTEEAKRAKEERDKVSDRDFFNQTLNAMRRADTESQYGNGNGHWGRKEFRNYFLKNGYTKDQLKGDWFKDLRKMANHGWDSQYYTDSIYNRTAQFNDKSNAAIAEEKAQAEKAAYNQKAGAWAQNQFNTSAIDEDFYKTLNPARIADLWAAAQPSTNGITAEQIKATDKKGNWYGNYAKAAEEAYFNSLNPFQKRAYIKWRNKQHWENAAGLTGGQFAPTDVTTDDIIKFANDTNNSSTMQTYYNKFFGDNGYLDEYETAIKPEESVRTAQQTYFNQPATPASTQYGPNNPRSYTPNSYSTYKQGGTLKMKINYFQEGGAVAQPAQQPATSAEDIQTQVVQLVQAAMQGDEKAAQTVQQIMQAADQGDEQAVQIAQMIQDIIQQMQGQAKAAKRGAKLSYIHSLKTGCPEGYSASYYQKGGHICKECLKNKLTEEQKKSAEKEAPKSAEGCKLSKGNLKRKLCAGKKLAEGDKLTPKGGQVNNQIPFNKRGNKAKQSYTSKFNAARARHERYFWYNGKTYNTLKAGEDPKEWAAKFKDNLTAGGTKSTQYDVGKSGGWEGVKGAKAGRYNSKGEWMTFDENAGHERNAVTQARGDEKPNGYRGYLPVDKPTDEVVVVGEGSDRGKTTANLTTGVVIGQTPQYDIVVTPKHSLVNGKAVSTDAVVTKANPREYGTSEPSDSDYNYFPMGQAGAAGGVYVVNPFLTPREGKNTK